jgi:hypothetical protein
MKPYTQVGACRLQWVRQTLRLDAMPVQPDQQHYRVLLANPATGQAMQWWHTCQGNPNADAIMTAIRRRTELATDPARFAAAHPELSGDVLRRLIAHEVRLAHQLEETTR